MNWNITIKKNYIIGFICCMVFMGNSSSKNYTTINNQVNQSNQAFFKTRVLQLVTKTLNRLDATLTKGLNDRIDYYSVIPNNNSIDQRRLKLKNPILAVLNNNGEKDKKIYPKSALVLAAYSYSASPNLSFAGFECPTTTSTTITITDNFTINDLQVGLIADMGSRHHLQATVTSPEGTSVLLTDINAHGFVGGMSDWDVRFDDASSGNLNDGDSDNIAAPNYESDRSANPSGTLADFDGEEANGVWTLAICDYATSSDNGGIIVSWKLDFDGTSACSASGDAPVSIQGTCNGTISNNQQLPI